MALPYFDLPEDVRHLVAGFVGDEEPAVYAELGLDSDQLVEEMYFLGIDPIETARRARRLNGLRESVLLPLIDRLRPMRHWSVYRHQKVNETTLSIEDPNLNLNRFRTDFGLRIGRQNHAIATEVLPQFMEVLSAYHPVLHRHDEMTGIVFKDPGHGVADAILDIARPILGIGEEESFVITKDDYLSPAEILDSKPIPEEYIDQSDLLVENLRSSGVEPILLIERRHHDRDELDRLLRSPGMTHMLDRSTPGMTHMLDLFDLLSDRRITQSHPPSGFSFKRRENENSKELSRRLEALGLRVQESGSIRDHGYIHFSDPLSLMEKVHQAARILYYPQFSSEKLGSPEYTIFPSSWPQEFVRTKLLRGTHEDEAMGLSGIFQ